ncbi:MAG: AmmeMemoRadiSam system protein B [Planctomycetales bacterium]|nr:AmmeMemoRadiSam system protein B [Planctomycetales bacterium]
MTVRKAAVAGQFYGGTPAECRAEIEECLPPRELKMAMPHPIAAAIVPHAGWVFSGELAATAFKAVRQVNGEVDTFVIFGAAHRYFDDGPAVYDQGAWETPLGRIEIDAELAARMVKIGAIANSEAHRSEHSIEVQVPFIQYLFPNARIVPIIVPVDGFDPLFGTRAGELIHGIKGKKIVCIASTDLTHYGPRYGFCPQGTGPRALRWAREVNDREFIDLVLRMEPERIIEVAMDKGSACGPAAVAVVVAAAKAMGRTCGVLLGHTTSHDIMLEKFNQFSEESVGYAAIVF